MARNGTDPLRPLNSRRRGSATKPMIWGGKIPSDSTHSVNFREKGESRPGTTQPFSVAILASSTTEDH